MWKLGLGRAIPRNGNISGIFVAVWTRFGQHFRRVSFKKPKLLKAFKNTGTIKHILTKILI
jgi:hypothetical protein